ncbi:unnamed protein product [Rhizopus stolonifer]
MSNDCIFCKITRQEIPSFKLIETEKSFAFMDIEPLSQGHSLIIPKHHAKFMHELPDEYLTDILPVAKKIALAGQFSQYNIIQNNGKLANQAVPHVHFHVIPKPDKETGLVIKWKSIETSKDEIKAYYETMMQKL